MKTNIGGSLLPSSGYDTYDLVRIGQGVGRVVRSEDADTHIAMVGSNESKMSPIAAHPNGYSCRELLIRMKKRDFALALNQFNYILACGGMCIKRENFLSMESVFFGK